ncbi:ribonuclease P protein subunit p20 [Camelus dromedarius]|uniref:ribonuclease P protein subunit p20 n=1 Tax=Camelus dromedarius TaxID=9838 RepID=UPI00311A37C8
MVKHPCRAHGYLNTWYTVDTQCLPIVGFSQAKKKEIRAGETALGNPFSNQVPLGLRRAPFLLLPPWGPRAAASWQAGRRYAEAAGRGRGRGRGGAGAGRVRGAETAGRREAQNSAENREPHGAVETELDPVEYTLRTRLPHRRPRRPDDIYVNTKSDFKAQLARCQLLLDGGARGQNARTEIYIHGLGLAINRAISIALQLHAGSFGPLKVAASTSTVELADELEPETDTREPLTRIRSNSAIHTRVFRVTPR